jgi:hypothetical protein
MEGVDVTKCPKNGDGIMSAIAATADRMIREAMTAHGVKKPEARAIVAHKLRIRPGALERLCKGTLVNADRIALRIDEYLAERLARKADEIEADLNLYRKTGGISRQTDIKRVEALLVEARKALGK